MGWVVRSIVLTSGWLRRMRLLKKSAEFLQIIDVKGSS
jgi:hypothetical protein